MSEKSSVDEIVDVARYLRNIRPIDPDEVVEYVPGASVSTVRGTLRTHAVQLDIRELAEGTFEHVPDDAPPPSPGDLARLPAGIDDTITDLLVDAFGSAWQDGDTGDALRRAIRALKADYFARASVTYDRVTAFGYLVYHLPGTWSKVQHVLAPLATAGELPTALRVLEVGTGVGGGALGLRSLLPPDYVVEYHGIEPSEPARDICTKVLADREVRNFTWDLTGERVESTDLGGPYDLVILANVLNELSDPVTTIERVSAALTDHGAIIAIAPGDERTSRGLRRVERDLRTRSTDLDVFAPTIRLWADMEPRDACWSFDERQPLAVPSFQRALDEGRGDREDERDPATGEFVNVDVRCTYSILRSDGRRRVDVRASRSAFAPLAESEGHIGNRVNVAVVKLSHSIASAGANPLYVIGDGSQRVEHFASHVHETSLNQDLKAAGYGDVLTMQHALVLYNDEESAYHVVVDEETIVDAVPA